MLPTGSAELLTRLSVWLALIASTIATGLRWLTRDLRLARGVWTLGCACFFVHVACAFGFYHGWSHAAAYRETARQTAELTGVRWGGGLYLNYLFAAVWLADVAWCWLAPASYLRRSALIGIGGQSFFLFMIVNGTIVFGHGAVRVLGVLICAALAAAWWKSRAPLPNR